MSAPTAWRAALVAELVGRLRLRQNLGETEAAHAVERCHKRVERGVFGWRGELLDAGDEVVALFPDAESALQAAIEIQQRVADLPPASGINLTLKIGVDGRATEPSASAPLIDAARRLADLAAVGQIVVSGWLAEALPVQFRGGLRRLGATEDDRKPVFECPWREAPAIGAAPPPASRLRLRRGGRIWILEKGAAPFVVGRDDDCGLVLADRSVSRRHARIELRDERWVVIDDSTNGTYVAQGGRKEVQIRHGELELTGSGTLAFGRAAAAGNDETVTFDLL